MINVHCIDQNLLENILSITVNVEDCNDNHPEFFNDVTYISITEDSKIGSYVTSLKAQDNDSELRGKISFDIIAGPETSFININSSTGHVVINDTMYCYQYPICFNFLIIACDSDPNVPLCALSELQIHVKNIDNHSPKFILSEYYGTVSENKPIGTSILTATVFDVNNGILGTVNYSSNLNTKLNHFSSQKNKVSEKPEYFSIQMNTGIVTTNTMFDYEKKNSYSFNVYAIDVTGRFTSVKVKISIKPEDEYYPLFDKQVFRFSITNEMVENSEKIIGCIQATDIDEGIDGDISYKLLTLHSHFVINHSTGAIKFNNFNEIKKVKEKYKLIASATTITKDSLYNITIIELLCSDHSSSIICKQNNNSVNNSNIIDVYFLFNFIFEKWIFILIITCLIIIATIRCFLFLKHIRKQKRENLNNIFLEKKKLQKLSYKEYNPLDTIRNLSVTNLNLGCNQFDGIHAGSSNDLAFPFYGIISQVNEQSPTVSRKNDVSFLNQRPRQLSEEILSINASQNKITLNNSPISSAEEYLVQLGIRENVSSSIESNGSVITASCNDAAVFESDFIKTVHDTLSRGNEFSSEVSKLDKPLISQKYDYFLYLEKISSDLELYYSLAFDSNYISMIRVCNEISQFNNDTLTSFTEVYQDTTERSLHQLKKDHPQIMAGKEYSLNTSMKKRSMIKLPIDHDIQFSIKLPVSPNFSPSLMSLVTSDPDYSHTNSIKK